MSNEKSISHRREPRYRPGCGRQGAQDTLAHIEEEGGQGSLIQFDVGDTEQCRQQLEAEVEAHGAFYGVVSNAGITRDDAFPNLSAENWHQVINTNLNSFYNVIQRAAVAASW